MCTAKKKRVDDDDEKGDDDAIMCRWKANCTGRAMQKPLVHECSSSSVYLCSDCPTVAAIGVDDVGLDQGRIQL